MDKRGGEKIEFYFTLSEGRDLITYKEGWLYGIGVGLFKGVGDTFSDNVFQYYRFYINSRNNFIVKVISLLNIFFSTVL